MDCELNSNISNLVKRTSIDATNYSLSWSKGASGAYYCSVVGVSNLGLSSGQIIGMFVGGWTNATCVIIPYLQSSEIRLMSNEAQSSLTGFTIYITYLNT